MTIYTPDNWVILRIGGNTPHYKVLGGWYGGYLNGNSWRMNSGVTRHTFDEEGGIWEFYGSSGSSYCCHVDNYRMNSTMASVYDQLKESRGYTIEVLEDQEWNTKDWDWLIGP
jgi:hypothetical protein